MNATVDQPVFPDLKQSIGGALPYCKPPVGTLEKSKILTTLSGTKIMRIGLKPICLGLLVAVGTTVAAGATTLTTFTDRTSFEAAAVNLSLETFNGVQGQPSFANTALVVNDLTLQTTGTLSFNSQRNAIDQPPTQFSEFDIDGTAVANVLLTDGDDVFTIVFSSMISAFFADFGAINDDILRTELVVNGAVATPSINGGVRGFGFTSDTLFNTITVRGIGSYNDGFSVDNIAYGGIAPIPLPAAAWLLFGALVALAGFGRRRAV